jgi:hypothetical protein
MKRTMFYMGLKEGSDKGFVIDNYKEVKITDKGYGQIGELLANYKKDKKWELGYKRQNHPLDKSIPDKTLPPIPPTEEVEKPEIPPIKKTTMISKPIKVKRDTLKPVIKQTAVKIVKPKIEAKKVVTAIKNVLPTDESKASGEYKADVERKIKARDARNAQKNK